jgi:glycosyltransferase involved in cell wall biosynthesis
MPDDYAASIPRVPSLPSQVTRPRWSVMIPTHNCAEYLREALRSVLAQDPGQEQMQIEVVDDCSTKDDPEAVVGALGRGRVHFYRQQCNVGVTRNFNTCVSRSLGHLVHILHGDDLVKPGFYAEIDAHAERFPEAAMIMTRSSYIDEAGKVLGSSPYVARYAVCERDASPLYYGNPLRAPSIVIQRSFYEQHGGFCEHLVHVADWEMWTRAARWGGAVMSDSLLTCYREFSGNDTSRLRRTAENLRDSLRLADIFSQTDQRFDRDRFQLVILSAATDQIRRFRQMGDMEAVTANTELYHDLRQISLPYAWRLKELVKSIPVLWDAARGIKRRLSAARRLP